MLQGRAKTLPECAPDQASPRPHPRRDQQTYAALHRIAPMIAAKHVGDSSYPGINDEDVAFIMDIEARCI